MAEGVPRSEAVRRAARDAGVARRTLYQDLLRDGGEAGRVSGTPAPTDAGGEEE
jgi:hypothetical protein